MLACPTSVTLPDPSLSLVCLARLAVADFRKDYTKLRCVNGRAAQGAGLAGAWLGQSRWAGVHCALLLPRWPTAHANRACPPPVPCPSPHAAPTSVQLLQAAVPQRAAAGADRHGHATRAARRGGASENEGGEAWVDATGGGASR